MSPEQVRGPGRGPSGGHLRLRRVLYEMLTGRRAFSGESPGRHPGRDPARGPAGAGRDSRSRRRPALDRILKRCLEKAPAERFQSARDLAFALEVALRIRTVASRNRCGRAGSPADPTGRAPGRRSPWPGGSRLGRCLPGAPAAYPGAGVTFHQLTFRQGALHAARFGPDGNVFYSAHWSGGDDDVYFTRPGNPEGRTMGLGDARLLSGLRTGELALASGPATMSGHPGAPVLPRGCAA